MDVTPVMATGAKVIDGYLPGGFRVSGQLINGALVLSPTAASAAPASSYGELNAEHLAALLSGPDKPEVLLIGVGAVQEGLAPKALRETAKAAGVVLEVMNTGAACRTWNVLLSEGRRVRALLFPV
jgi:uncharacterized protein